VRYSDGGKDAVKREGKETTSRDDQRARDAGGSFPSWIVAFIF
jgi:hypothetical protein